MIKATDVLREVEERMRNERFYPPDWVGCSDPEKSDVAIIVQVLVAHINRALKRKTDRFRFPGDE